MHLVRKDREVQNPPLTQCDDARRLLASYRAAVATYDRVRCPGFQRLAPDHITLREAAQARADAQVALLQARRAYWQHVDKHACRRLLFTTH